MKEDTLMFDTAIIGTGPAGISAALTLKALKKNIILFGSGQLSGKIRAAEKIRNYPGLPMVTGGQMQQAFLEQLEQMEIPITEKTVTGIYDMGDHYGILCDQEQFAAKTVILATGVEAVKPIEGELEFVGRGVSYCATCDGFLYKNKTIAVLCTTKDLEHEIDYLASMAAKVYLIPLYKDVRVNAENIEIVMRKPQRITGAMKVQQVEFADETVDVDGVFMLKQAVTPSVLLYGLECKDGHIVVDRSCRTNLLGCFAAGDCTGRPYQYVKAAGEGNVAAHSVVEYLAEKKNQ
jgi:thioredoxin reductase (NADPH)